MERTYFTVAEVAEITKKKPDVVRKWIRDGKLKAVRPGGKTWLVPSDALDKFMGVEEE